jgi:hypothetical protein
MQYSNTDKDAMRSILIHRDKQLKELEELNENLKALNGRLRSGEICLRNELWDLRSKLGAAEEELLNERKANEPLRTVACDLAIENQSLKKRLKRC